MSELLEPTAPSERAHLEIELDRAQSSQVYAELGLPDHPRRQGHGATTPCARWSACTRSWPAARARRSRRPEEARRANTELRAMMRARDNHLPEIEALAEDQLRKVGHVAGALTHRSVRQMAEQLGFELVHVHDLPHSARSVTDLENGRIYLPPASIPGGHGLRSMALQAIAHRLLDHAAPTSYAEFLHQRLEINYFASACLMPLTQSVDFLRQAKADRNIAIEDFRDAFGTTHESAALRFTNIATPYLDMTWHFLRVGDDGAVYKAYENDGLRLPVDVTGSTEGEIVCRRWSARRAFARTNRTTEFYQYTDTPQGSFFESTQIGTSSSDEFSITLGRAVRRLEVVPRAGDDPARAVTLPGRQLLQAPAGRPRPALEEPRLDQRQGARAHLLAAAVRHVPRASTIASCTSSWRPTLRARRPRQRPPRPRGASAPDRPSPPPDEPARSVSDSATTATPVRCRGCGVEPSGDDDRTSRPPIDQRERVADHLAGRRWWRRSVPRP